MTFPHQSPCVPKIHHAMLLIWTAVSHEMTTITQARARGTCAFSLSLRTRKGRSPFMISHTDSLSLLLFGFPCLGAYESRPGARCEVRGGGCEIPAITDFRA